MRTPGQARGASTARCTSTIAALGYGAAARYLPALSLQDQAALRAIVHLVELWERADEPGKVLALSALRCALAAMQPRTRPIAGFALETMLDDRGRALWNLVAP